MCVVFAAACCHAAAGHKAACEIRPCHRGSCRACISPSWLLGQLQEPGWGSVWAATASACCWLHGSLAATPWLAASTATSLPGGHYSPHPSGTLGSLHMSRSACLTRLPCPCPAASPACCPDAAVLCCSWCQCGHPSGAAHRPCAVLLQLCGAGWPPAAAAGAGQAVRLQQEGAAAGIKCKHWRWAGSCSSSSSWVQLSGVQHHTARRAAGSRQRACGDESTCSQGWLHHD